MKCINCDVQNSLGERIANSRRCKACSHRFVFEPQTMSGVKFTDKFFAKLISDNSANNTFQFTEKQLFYLLNKRLIKKRYNTSDSIILTYSAFLLGIVGILSQQQANGLFFTTIGVLIIISIAAVDIYQRNKTIRKLVISPEKFQDYLSSWKSVNPINGILTLSEQENLPNSINPDITAYSFDRVIICDSAEIANLLIANNFHFENNSAVLSIDGYPENIFDTVMEMLRRNEDLKVYVLHDASPKGVSVVNTLSNNPNWFSDTSNSNVTIYDLGLLPRQVFNNSNFFTQISEDSAREAQELPSEIKQNLTEKEIKWLEAGKFVELESFTTQRLLRVISQGILKIRQSNVSSDVFVDYSGGGDAGGDITTYSDDCFG